MNKKSIWFIVRVLCLSCFVFFNLGESYSIITANNNSSPYFSNEESTWRPFNDYGQGYQQFLKQSESPVFKSQNQKSNTPILFGPGGDPIGGVPVGDHSDVLILVLLGYVSYSVIKRYKKLKSQR